MDYLPLEIAENGDALRADRIGFAKLAKLAFDGCDLQPMLQQTLRKIGEGTASAGETIDLSVIAQLLGNKQAGLDIQSQVLSAQRLFRSPCASAYPSLRVLALAAAMDVGGNTPIEFLVEDFDIELTTLYVVPGAPLPPLPDHDVALVVASDSEECRDALKEMAALASRWPRPLPRRRRGDGSPAAWQREPAQRPRRASREQARHRWACPPSGDAARRLRRRTPSWFRSEPQPAAFPSRETA